MTGSLIDELTQQRRAIADEAAALARARNLLELTAADQCAWIRAVEGLIESLDLYIADPAGMRTYADVDASAPMASMRFILDAAHRHSARGVSTPMFVLMLKTFRDACVAHVSPEHASVVARWFEAAEIACLFDHEVSGADAHLREMSATAREMSRKRERIEMALAAVAPPLVLCDAQGGIIGCSDSAVAVLRGLGCPPADDGGIRTLPTCLTEITDAFLRGVSTESTEDITVVIDGDRRVFAVQMRKVQGAAHTTQGCVVLLLDVTEARQAEERLRGQDAAMASNQRLASIGWLAAGVAHEINNPLSTVMSYSEMLMDHVPFDKMPWLEEVLAEAGRIAEIVRRLQDLAQPGGEVSDITVQSLIDTVVQLTGAHLRKRHTYLKINLPKSPIGVRCDPKAMQQALISSLLYLCALQRQTLEPDTNASIIITAAQMPTEIQVALFADSAVLPIQHPDDSSRYRSLQNTDLDQPFISLEWARQISQGQHCALDALSDDAGVTLVLHIPSGT